MQSFSGTRVHGAEHHPYRRVGPTQAVSVLSISCKIRSCSVIHSGMSASAMIVVESGGQRGRCSAQVQPPESCTCAEQMVAAACAAHTATTVLSC